MQDDPENMQSGSGPKKEEPGEITASERSRAPSSCIAHKAQNGLCAFAPRTIVDYDSERPILS